MARRGDRRATIIDLTPKGKAVQEKVAMRYSKFMRNALQVFTTDERETLRKLLENLRPRGCNGGKSSMKNGSHTAF